MSMEYPTASDATSLAPDPAAGAPVKMENAPPEEKLHGKGDPASATGTTNGSTSSVLVGVTETAVGDETAKEYPVGFRLGMIIASLCLCLFLSGLVSLSWINRQWLPEGQTDRMFTLGPNNYHHCRAENYR